MEKEKVQIKKRKVMSMKSIKPIFDDEFAGQPPAKRALSYIESQKKNGKHVVGIYCGYAPVELMFAFDIIPVPTKTPQNE